MSEDQNVSSISPENDVPKPLFTKSRILFLICVFIVMLIPLIYQKFEYLLK